MSVTKIAIGLPTNRGLKPKNLQSVLDMVAYKDYDYEIIIATEGFNTAENRTWLTVKAVKAGCTHLLLLDDDMIYDPSSLETLLSHDKDIIGAKYHNRRGGENGGEIIEYLLNPKLEGKSEQAIKEYADANGFDDVESMKFLTSETKPFKCKALGGGLLLVKTDVFKKVKQPWYWYKINDNGAVEMSNDWWFCEKAREAGYEIWCEPTVKPGHIGIKEY